MIDNNHDTTKQAPTLTAAEQSAACKIEDELLTLITDSVVARYDGDIGILGEDKHGAMFYVPLDTDDIRDPLTKLWGDRVPPQMLDKAFEELTTEGAEDWPEAFCEEAETEEELFRKAMDADYDRECEEEHKKRLREQGTVE